jgi:hypothetical protein
LENLNNLKINNKNTESTEAIKYSSVDFSCFKEDEKSDIDKWYNTITNQYNTTVLFANTRTYQLFTLISESKKDNLLDNNTKYVTDISQLDVTDELNNNSTILICIDILIHGRSLNIILQNIETKLGVDDLSSRVKILACYKSDMPILLFGKYRPNLEYIKKVEGMRWRNTSNAILQFILNNDAIYECSEYIDKETFEKIISTNDFESTTYQNQTEYSTVEVISHNNEVKAILAIRIKHNEIEDGYRVIPFVYLSELNKNLVYKLTSDTSSVDTYDESITIKIIKEILIENFNKKYHIESISSDRNTQNLEELLETELNGSIALIGNKETEVKEALYNYFYQLALDSEKQAVELSQKDYLSKKLATKIDGKQLSEIIASVTIKPTVMTIIEIIRYTMQALDLNIININDKQEITCGEQGLLIKAIKVYENMPMIELMWRKCIQYGFSIEDELKAFYDSEYCEEKLESELDKLIDFSNDLKQIGQDPTEWCGNFLNRIPKTVEQNGNKVVVRSIIMSKQYLRLSQYMKFISIRKI